MKCVKCGGKTMVVDSAGEDDFVLRRRKCKDCGKWFFTQELLVENQILTQKKLYRLKEKCRGGKCHGEVI